LVNANDDRALDANVKAAVHRMADGPEGETTNRRFQIEDCRFQIEVVPRGIQSAINNLKSEM
jgi:hypothetical protein